MKTHSLLVFSSLIFLIGCHQLKETSTPNVILIYADDLGRGLLSYEGQKIIKTPNIDRLAQEGVRFENAYGCHYCAPARASMLSGYHDCRSDKWQISRGGVYLNSNEEYPSDEIQRILNEQMDEAPENEVFLAQVFQKAGYKTGEIGKLDWGFASTHERLTRHGWDYHYGYYDHVRAHGFYPPYLFENGKKIMIEGNTHSNCSKEAEWDENGGYEKRWDMNGKTHYSQNLFLEKILQFIRDNKHENFFLYHPTQLPHGPTSIPEIHPDFTNNPNLTELEKAYASMVKMLDDHVGVIIDELKELGLYENTLVIFSADNGHEIYYPSKGKMSKPVKNMITGKKFDNIQTKFTSNIGGDVFNGNDGMSGLKRDNWEGGVRVPLIYRWPNHIEGGKTLNHLVSNYDLLTTFADMLDVDVLQPKDGISYWPVLFGKESREHEHVVFNSILGPALVTSDGWKIRYHKKTKLYQLYNIANDYEETTDLAKRYPEKLQVLKEMLLRECGNIAAPKEPRLPKLILK